jgi:hypothetical protein
VQRIQLAQWWAKLFVPIAVALIGLAAYNHARFGDVLEFGYRTQNVHERVRKDLDEHGQFSVVFVPRNLYTMAVAPPIRGDGLFGIRPSEEGMGMFLTMPVVFLLPLALLRGGTLVRWTLASLGLLLIPLLLYYNNGWAQFGYRFSLDFLAPLIVLIGCACEWPGARRAFVPLALIGLVMNLWGTAWWVGLTGYLGL